jgi:Glycosyl transferase family 2
MSAPTTPAAVATVTVVVPLYNKESTIGRALTSILAQTVAVTEILVINDGSTDGSCEVVRSFSDGRMRLIDQENAGPAAARNRGLQEATGSFIAFLDADDEWYPSFIERTLTPMLNENNGVSFVLADYDNGSTRERPPRVGLAKVGPDANAALIDGLERFVGMQFVLTRTPVMRAHGGYFDEVRCQLGEDQFLATKLLCSETFFVVTERVGFYHREDSALHGHAPTTAPPLLPIFTHLPHLLSTIPPANHHLVTKFVSVRAMRAAQMYCKLGRPRIALRLVTDFGRHQPFAALSTVGLLPISPLLPMVRRLVRRAVPRRKQL